jgi:Ca2+-binding RTX toxin-like protein
MKPELLESRRLYSVSVAQGYPGYYEVRGDDADDVIAITISSENSSFSLNGETYGGVSYVSVFSFDGNDTVSVAIEGQGPIGASVIAGAGDDDVSVSGGGAVWGEAGNDTIRLSNSVRGEAYGGPGDDRISISGVCPDAQVEGGPGNDLIDASGSTYGIFAQGDQGDDMIFGSNSDDQIDGGAGRDLMVGYGGNDIFSSADMEQDRIIGGAGIDIAFVDATEAGVWGVEYVFYV